MVKLVVTATESDTLNVKGGRQILIDSDDVLFANEAENGNTILIFHAHGLPEVTTTTPFSVYTSIVCAGVEHLSTAIKISS